MAKAGKRVTIAILGDGKHLRRYTGRGYFIGDEDVDFEDGMSTLKRTCKEAVDMISKDENAIILLPDDDKSEFYLGLLGKAISSETNVLHQIRFIPREDYEKSIEIDPVRDLQEKEELRAAKNRKRQAAYLYSSAASKLMYENGCHGKDGKCPVHKCEWDDEIACIVMYSNAKAVIDMVYANGMVKSYDY